MAGLLLLLCSTQVRANWFCGVMDPYPGYGHPSFYFPPAVADFYAGYGYPSLIPGTSYYTPVGQDVLHHAQPSPYVLLPYGAAAGPDCPWPPPAPAPYGWTVTMPTMSLYP
jgi:hypothetical protein